MKRIIYLILIAVMFFWCGCQGPQKRPKLPPKKIASKAEAAAVLADRRLEVIPLRASGKFKYTYYKNDKRKEENADVSLAFEPPKGLFFRAKALGMEVIRLGSNKQEFWLQMKPKEISQYFWGRWEQLDGCPGDLLISPQAMLDAFGMVSIDSSWMLIKDKDMLVKLGDKGLAEKSLTFLKNTNYLVGRIEYYDKEELISLGMNLSGYEQVDGGSPIPTRIEITAYNRGVETAKIKITLKNPKKLESIGKKTFKRPEPKGFDHVFEMGYNCKFIEQ